MDPPGTVLDVSYRSLTPDDLENQCETDTVKEDCDVSLTPIDPEFQPEHEEPCEMLIFEDSERSSPAAALDCLASLGNASNSPGLVDDAETCKTDPFHESIECENTEREEMTLQGSSSSECLANTNLRVHAEGSLECLEEVPACSQHEPSGDYLSEDPNLQDQVDKHSLLRSGPVWGNDTVQNERPASSNMTANKESLPIAKTNRHEKCPRKIYSCEQSVEPGAYLVRKVKQEGKETVNITVPANAKANELFEVQLGVRHVRLVCPPTAGPGSVLSVRVDKEDRYKQILLKPAILTVSPVAEKVFGSYSPGTIGGAYRMLPDLKKVYKQAKHEAPSVRTKLITIPKRAVSGEKFDYSADGKRYRLLCPETCKPGDRLRIAIQAKKALPEAPAKTQTISVVIPDGISPGDAFAVQLSSFPSPITITCPSDSHPGDLMDLNLPTDEVLASIRVQYPSETWVRTVRFRDLKFQWVRLTGEYSSIVDENQTFHFYKSAFCRTLRILEGNDPRMFTGRVSFVPAANAIVESHLVVDSETTVTYADISLLQGSPRIDKHDWFKDMCRRMVKVGDTHIKIAVRRDHLLPDSLTAVMSLDKDDLRRVWELNFIGEEAVDQGGPMKEWFELVTLKLLDPDAGYFVFCPTKAAVEINPTSYILCAGDHLLYYRFFGRLLGRALFCGQLIKGHFTSLFFKFLLGWPINSKDITDATLYKSLCEVATADEVDGYHYTFTATENAFFKKVDHELIDNGLTTFVSTDNRDLFLERMIRYHLFERTLPQLTEVVLGFFDVIPEPLLTIFDAKELELILCGMPHIDLKDWQANTEYSGLFSETGPLDRVVRWFWRVVKEFEPELRARLLQFATGSSGVPFLGFQHLRGCHDDSPTPFTIEGVSLETCLYPKAHTCFNKIDLPVFSTIEDLREKLTFSITTAFVGFDDE